MHAKGAGVFRQHVFSLIESTLVTHEGREDGMDSKGELVLRCAWWHSRVGQCFMVLTLLGYRSRADQSPMSQLPLGWAVGFGWINPAVETIPAPWLETRSQVLARSVVLV